MSPNDLERLLLLEQSGELSAPQRRRLDAELDVSAEARRLRARLRDLAAAIPAPAFAPAPDAAQRIAARLRKVDRPGFSLLPAWKPALAIAAVLALLLGVRTLHVGSVGDPIEYAAISIPAVEEEWTDPLEAEFAELETLLFAISSDDSLEITEL